MPIAKVRQMVIHSNPVSGIKPIFDHVDCEKLPKNPESNNDRTTSVAGGNLLAAMFGTAEEDEEELQGYVSEPDVLKKRRALMAKEEKPRGTTGIKIHERITWWQDDLDTKDKKKKKTPKDKKKKKEKKSSKWRDATQRDKIIYVSFFRESNKLGEWGTATTKEKVESTRP